MKTTGASPISNPEDFKNGDSAIVVPLFEVTPVKISMMENSAAYIVEDAKGNIYCFSVGAVYRLGWHELNLPESDAYKKHMENYIKKNGKQYVG